MQVIKLTGIDKLILVLKMVIGSAISWELAILFGSKYPYLGPISLILCIQATLLKSIRFGVARMIGTIIGVLSVYILASSLHANGLSIAFVMLVSLMIPLLLRANGTTLHQIALSVLLVLEFEHKLHGYGFDRIRDSIIGISVALLLQYVYPPDFTKKVIEHVEEFPNKLAKSLKSLAAWIQAGEPSQNYFNQNLNLIHTQIIETEKQFQKAKLSLKFNPFSKKSKSQLHDVENLLKAVYQVSLDIDFLFTIMDEWEKTGNLTKDSIDVWTQNFLLLELSLRNWNEGKTITEVTFIKTSSNEMFNIPAIWHSQHLIATLKQYPRPIWSL